MEVPLSTTVNIEDEMRQSYMDYAMSVIIGRALPDVRDGLKPVQRRVLYAMIGEGLTPNRKHSKCAGVVGEVLKRLHPHGDASVYDALVRLAQPWNLRYPLVDGQGNFGSIDGDPAAAYRYTECRMTSIAERMLHDIDKDTVDFVANFDDSNVEPVVLPAIVPNLLINGTSGIAVGMATHIPPHNLGEVVSAALATLEDPNISPARLMEFIPGPDFPTGGIIYGRSGITSAYMTGRGSLRIRARTAIETLKTEKREVEAIIITEIPYQVNKSKLIEKIADLVNEKEIEGISRIRDESDRTGMRIVLELKRDARSEVTLNQLFKLTPMQTSFGIINLAIVEGQPVVCTLMQLISHFLDHRRDVITRRTLFELRKALERMHLLEGFRTVLIHIDEVIQIIKGSETPPEAKASLMGRFSLSDVQAQAILDLRLQRLTGMERLAIEQEHAELAEEIARLQGILADTKKVDGIIKDELSDVRDNYSDARRTEILDDGAEIFIEDLIEDDEMVVTVSHKGYIKRTPISDYRAQKRGGKGILGTSQDEDDFAEHIFVASALSNLLIFTTLGRVFAFKVYEVPESARTSRGRALVNLLQLKEGEKPTTILPLREFVEGSYIFMATEKGIIKRTELSDFARVRKNGMIAVGLEENEVLIGAGLTHGSDHILLATKNGMAIRFMESDIRVMGRPARGVKGINLQGDDAVVSMSVLGDTDREGERVDKSGMLLTVCENGYGKRTVLDEYRVQSRGGKGLIDIQTGERNGNVVGGFATNEKSGIMLITSGGNVIRMMASDIRLVGRNTRGVKLVNLSEGEKVLGVAHLTEKEVQENEDVVQVAMPVETELVDTAPAGEDPVETPPVDDAEETDPEESES